MSSVVATAAAVVVVSLVAFAGLWAWNVHLSPEAKAHRAEAMAASASLRGAWLSGEILRDSQYGDTGQKAFAMDWKVSENQMATLVSSEDGTTSIYFSSGGGIIGVGELGVVKPVAARFRAAFGGLESHFRVVDTWPPPPPGNYVFYYLDRNATRATSPLSPIEVESAGHALHALAAEAQNLIAAIRTAKPAP